MKLSITTIASVFAELRRLSPNFVLCNANNDNNCWSKRTDPSGQEYCAYNANAPEECLSFKCHKSGIKTHLSYDLFSFSHDPFYSRRQLKQDIMYGKRALLINGQESTCMYSFTKSGLNLNFPLGECGMELSSNENNQIIYTMKIEMMELDDTGASSFILDVAINVECRYESTRTITAAGKKTTSDKVWTGSSQAHLIGQGNTAWLETFNVRTFTDSAYQHETDEILAMGRAIYVDVSTNNTFKIDSNGNQIVWYIDTCTLTDDSTNQSFDIIRNTCRSTLTQVRNLNPRDSPILIKGMQKHSRFSYTSFGFDGGYGQNELSLDCSVNICLQKNDGRFYGRCDYRQPCDRTYIRP